MNPFNGSPAKNEDIIDGIRPGTGLDGEPIACISIDLETPAAMKRLIPEPIPHLLTTSSMNITIIPPNASWAITAITTTGTHEVATIVAQPPPAWVVQNGRFK